MNASTLKTCRKKYGIWLPYIQREPIIRASGKTSGSQAAASICTGKSEKWHTCLLDVAPSTAEKQPWFSRAETESSVACSIYGWSMVPKHPATASHNGAVPFQGRSISWLVAEPPNSQIVSYEQDKGIRRINELTGQTRLNTCSLQLNTSMGIFQPLENMKSCMSGDRGYNAHRRLIQQNDDAIVLRA